MTDSIEIVEEDPEENIRREEDREDGEPEESDRKKEDGKEDDRKEKDRKRDDHRKRYRKEDDRKEKDGKERNHKKDDHIEVVREIEGEKQDLKEFLRARIAAEVFDYETVRDDTRFRVTMTLIVMVFAVIGIYLLAGVLLPLANTSEETVIGWFCCFAFLLVMVFLWGVITIWSLSDRWKELHKRLVVIDYYREELERLIIDIDEVPESGDGDSDNGSSIISKARDYSRKSGDSDEALETDEDELEDKDMYFYPRH